MPQNAKYPTPKDFLKAIKPAASAIEAKYGIPWLFAATQAAHESRYGNSKLAVNAFNLFGVTGDDTVTKAGAPDELSMDQLKTWLGEHPEVPIVIMRTQEESPYPPEKIHHWNRPGDIFSKTWKENHTEILVDRPFRRYASYEESLTLWASLIMRKYPEAYDAAVRSNFLQFADALQMGRYATDSNYAAQLISMHDTLEAMA